MENDTSLQDDEGTSVVISGIPERIVSLAPSNTEILGSLGLMDRVVADTDYCDYPVEAQTKPKIGGFSSVDIEKVVSFQPDLILAAPTNGRETIDHLRRLGMVVLVLDPKNIAGITSSIQMVGAATGTKDQAVRVVETMHQQETAVESMTRNSTGTPRVAHVVGYNPIYVSGNNTYQDEVIGLAGGINAFGNVDQWGSVSTEEFLQQDPDYILVNAGDGMTDQPDQTNLLYDYFRNDTRLSHLKAVQNGHIILVDSDTISRGGPRIMDAVEEVARSIHPESSGGNLTGSSITESPRRQSPGFTAVLTGAASLFILAIRRRGED
jgi:iron complex transport system substrate-binding protein